MMQEITRFQSKHGGVFNTKEECIADEAKQSGRTHKCPKCNGTTKVNGLPIIEQREDKEATAWGGQFAEPVYRDVIVGYRQIQCDCCDGWGYTHRELVPVTESKLVGWVDKLMERKINA